MADLRTCINEVATYLSEGFRWHMRTANELRKMPNKRGYARIHDDQAEEDSKKLIELMKLVRDNMQYAPVADTAYVAKADNYTISSLDDFKNHFKVWMDREKIFIEAITEAINLVRDVDLELYQMFICMGKELKCECSRAEWIMLSLADVEWQPHHMAVVSKWLHEQAEACPGSLDFNIG